jgi:hypothetical protein
MPRIAKADVDHALQLAANAIVEAGGADGRTSRAELKKLLPQLAPSQRNLVDIFFKFVDSRDFKAGAQVTAKDVKAAVAYAKEHLVAKYDLNDNGLSADEIKKMSLTGKRAVDLARALKAAPQTALSVAELSKAVTVAAKDADYMSETDSTPAPISGRPATSAGVTIDNLKAALGSQLTTLFAAGGDSYALNDLAFEIHSAAESKSFMTGLATPRPDDEDAQKLSAKAFGALNTLLGDNLTDVRMVKVGPKDANGKLATDQGLYQYLLVGKASDGQLAGLQFASVET